MWKWLVGAVLVGAVFVMIGVAINYGPFYSPSCSDRPLTARRAAVS